MSTTLTSVLCVRTTHTSSPHTINYNSTVASYPTSLCVYFISVLYNYSVYLFIALGTIVIIISVNPIIIIKYKDNQNNVWKI